ncbi:hypothetical protein ABI59_21980 [Acidobacteria bacterium Mor1]|nr:hypothetical protein ABI59_21980 [Acidobacteria bacterium Mor1]
MQPGPANADALAGLRMASPEDYPGYARALAASRPEGSSYFLAGLLAYQRKGSREILLGEDHGSVCIYRFEPDGEKPRLDIYLAPTPMDPQVLRRCVERANDFNGDRSARVLRIDDADADAATEAGLRVRKRREQFVFAPEKYRDLGGKELYTIRRNVSRVEKLEEVEVQTYTPAHRKACRELLERWRTIHREQHGSAGGYGSSKRVIELAGRLPEEALTGQVILLEGKLVAFSFGGSIHPGMACSFERKCDNAIAGLTYFQLRSFLLHLGGYARVNDGSDAGRSGLQQLKQSFRPVAMHPEYRGYQA